MTIDAIRQQIVIECESVLTSAFIYAAYAARRGHVSSETVTFGHPGGPRVLQSIAGGESKGAMMEVRVKSQQWPLTITQRTPDTPSRAERRVST